MSKRITKTTAKFSVEQDRYMLARAAHETALEAYQAECERAGLVVVDGMSDEDAEKVWDRMDEIRAKHNVDRLATARTEAERRLIDWSLDRAAMFAPEHRATIEMLRAKKAATPSVWDRLVEAAARIAA